MKRDLQFVQLAKTDTCLTYVLKRGGYDLPLLRCSSSVEVYFDLLPFTEGVILERGDILMYTDKERTATVPDTISPEGHITFHQRLMLRHFAIYEGDGIITDATISSRDYPFLHTLRRQYLGDASSQPSFVLKLKAEYVHTNS